MRKTLYFLCILILLAGCDRKENAAALNSKNEYSFNIKRNKHKVSNITLNNNKALVLNFFTTTCGACKEEIPNINMLHSSYQDKVTFLGILGDKTSKENIENYLDKYVINYDIINKNKSVQLLSNAVGGVFGVPVTIVFDKNGHVIQKFSGLVPKNTLKKAILQAI